MTAEELAALLPAVFRNALPADFILGALLDVMEGLQDPVEVKLRTLDRNFAPLTTSDRFVPVLARWVDLEWLYAGESETDPFAAAQAWFDAGLPIGRLRLLIEESYAISQARGTAPGIVRFLEIATGVDGFAVDDASSGGQPFHMGVHVPTAARGQMTLIERIVNAEKPAYTTWQPVTENAERG